MRLGKAESIHGIWLLCQKQLLGVHVPMHKVVGSVQCETNTSTCSALGRMWAEPGVGQEDILWSLAPCLPELEPQARCLGILGVSKHILGKCLQGQMLLILCI